MVPLSVGATVVDTPVVTRTWALQVARDYVLQVDQARSLFKSVVQYRMFLMLKIEKNYINIVPGMLKYKYI